MCKTQDLDNDFFRALSRTEARRTEEVISSSLSRYWHPIFIGDNLPFNSFSGLLGDVEDDGRGQKASVVEELEKTT